MLGLIFLFLGLIGGYLIFQYVPGLKSEPSNNQDVAIEDPDPPTVISTIPSTTFGKTNETAIQSPPSDIEVMCSVSNLPGGL